ncbi:hypothetical protein TKK_0018586 [Trichogramma kaykai]
MCETRWIENHNGLLKFKELLKPIVLALDDLSEDDNAETLSNARAFLRAIINGEFVIILLFVCKIFSYTLPLCKILQSPLCDLKAAIDHVERITECFTLMRKNIDSEFSKIFEMAQSIMTDLGGEIRIPRRSSLQTLRCNVDAETPESYFRISVVIPVLDDFNEQLSNRFIDHKEVLTSLSFLLPSICCQKNTTINVESLKIYETRIDLCLLEAEFELWKMYWSRKDEIDYPSCAVEALAECNEELFPNIFLLLKIYATLPVTTCTPERSFSTLRRLKTYLRNSCGQNRLSGLASMAVHRDINVSTNEVIDIFAQKNRRLDFIL